MAHLSFIFVSSNRFIMKYKEKEKQKAVKVKGQKRRVVEQSECKKEYSDEEIAQITDYDYGYLLDMMYYKFERMVAFFKSKHTHVAGAKKVAKQIEVAMRLINIIQGRSYTDDYDNLEKIVNQRNRKMFSHYYELYSLRQEKPGTYFFSI